MLFEVKVFSDGPIYTESIEMAKTISNEMVEKQVKLKIKIEEEEIKTTENQWEQRQRAKKKSNEKKTKKMMTINANEAQKMGKNTRMEC